MDLKKISAGIVITGMVGLLSVCGAVFFAPDFVDLNKYKQTVFDAVKKETGYEIKCEDIKIKRSFSPYINVHLYHSVVLYPDKEIFLKLKESDVSVKFFPLLFKKLVIKDVKLERPIINIYLYEDFSSSLEKYSLKNKQINTEGFSFDGISGGVICNDYKVNFHDLSIKKDFFAQGGKLTLKEVEKAKKIRIITKGELISKTAKYINYDFDVITDYMRENPRFTFSPFKTVYENSVNADICSHLKTGKNNELFGNLNVKNLSLKADKLLMKNNNLDITFKGEHLSFNAILHSSPKDEVKLNGNIQYSGKKYADINVLAKDNDVEALSILLNKITDILNIKNPLREITMKGIVSANFNVQSDFKKLKSEGDAVIKNVIIKHSSLPYSVTDINANIDFNNNKIFIKNASAKVNTTPVTLFGEVNEDMSFKIKTEASGLDAVNVIRLFDLDKNLPVNITKGKLSFDADIKGILNKNYEVTADAKTTGAALVEKTSKIPVNIADAVFTLKGTDKKYTGEITANSIEAIAEKQKIKADIFKATFNEKDIIIPSNKITYPAVFNYSGEIKNYTDKPVVNLDFNGKISSAVTASIIKNYTNLPNKPAGNITLSGHINHKDENTALKAVINADTNNYISYAVIKELLNKPSTLNIDCVSSKNGILINDISLSKNSAGKIISISGEINSLSNPEAKNLKIKIPEFISGKSDFFGGEDFSLKGDFTVNGKISAPDLKGNMKISKYNLHRFSTETRNTDIIFNGHSIKLVAPEISVMNSILNVTADLKHDYKSLVVENMLVHGNNLDISPIFGRINNYVNAKELAKLTVKKGSITINNAKLLNLTANDIAGDFSFNKNTLYLTDVSASTYGGRTVGNAEYNLPQRHLKIKAKAYNVDIKNSVYDLCSFEDNLSGRADVNADISMYIGQGNIPLRTLSGSADFTSRNGKAGTLGKFEYYLSAKNIIHKGIMNATLNKIASAISKDDTSNYREAKGTLKFKEGYITTEGITTKGSKMSLFVTGKHNMLTDISDLKIYGRVSNEIKSKLGNIGDISAAKLFNAQIGTKEGIVLPMPDTVINVIPGLYNKPDADTSMFYVNISGKIKSVNSLNDFDWIIPVGNYFKTSDNENTEVENTDNSGTSVINSEADDDLPDFSTIGN